MTQNTIELCHRLFDAVEQGNPDVMRSVITSRAVVWHNFDGAEKSFESIIPTLLAGRRVMLDQRYIDRRYEALLDGAVLRHTLTGTVDGEHKIAMPIIIRVFTSEGLLYRFEEYFDPAAVAPLQAALQKSTGQSPT